MPGLDLSDIIRLLTLYIATPVLIIYSTAVVHRRRKTREPVLRFSLLRLVICVFVCGALLGLNIIPSRSLFIWEENQTGSELRQYGWPVICGYAQDLKSGVAKNFDISLAIPNFLLLLLVAFIILTIRLPENKSPERG